MKFLEATSQNTVNSIFNRQNEPFLLQCQVAQRSMYSRAKHMAQYKALFTMIFAVISLIASILDVEWLSATSSLMAVAVLIFNKYSNEYIASNKKRAASIQQYIDVTLYTPAIDCSVSDWGEMPNNSDVAVMVSEYENADTSAMENWYSDYSDLLGDEEVFRCQCENVRWDYNLHRAFRFFLIIFLVVVVIAMLTAFIIVDPGFVKLVCVLSWFAPISEYAYSIYKEIGESITLLQKTDKLRIEIEEKLKSDSAKTIKQEVIALQYKIWERRKEGFLIPDWFYEWHRKKQQKQEDQIAKTIQDIN